MRLAARLLPEDGRDEVLGDLMEHWARDVRERRWLPRMAWAWRQLLVALVARLRFGANAMVRPSSLEGDWQ